MVRRAAMRAVFFVANLFRQGDLRQGATCHGKSEAGQLPLKEAPTTAWRDFAETASVTEVLPSLLVATRGEGHTFVATISRTNHHVIEEDATCSTPLHHGHRRAPRDPWPAAALSNSPASAPARSPACCWPTWAPRW